MKSYELTHQEMADCLDVNGFETVLKAENVAQKKLLEWLGEPCPHSSIVDVQNEISIITLKRECSICWLSLLKNFGL